MTQEQSSISMDIKLRNLEAQIADLQSQLQTLKGYGTVDGSLVRGRIEAQTGEIGELIIAPNGKIYFGVDKADYIADNLLHFETGDSETTQIEWFPSDTSRSSRPRMNSTITSSQGDIELMVDDKDNADIYAYFQLRHKFTTTKSVRGFLTAYYNDVNDEATVEAYSDEDSLSYVLLNAHKIKMWGLPTWGQDQETIASGAISIAGTSPWVQVDTQSAASSDELDTINYDHSDLETGAHVMLSAQNTARTVVVKHNTGNIHLAEGADFALDSSDKRILLSYDGTDWIEVSRSVGVASKKIIVKPSDETVNNSSTFQSDDDFTFAIGANENYVAEYHVIWESGATPNIKFQMSVPSGAQYSVARIEWEASAGGVAYHQTTWSLSGTGHESYAVFRVGIVNSSTAGNVVLQWAQNTADASNTIIYAGSYMTYEKQV